MDDPPRISIGANLIAVGLATIVFVIVWTIVYVIFHLLSRFQGLSGNNVYLELVIPCLAGYAAMAAVDKWIPKANTRFTFFGFSIFVVIGICAYIGYVAPVASEIGKSFWDMLLAIGSAFSGLLGARLCVGRRI